jgi:hypothetical protein
MLRPHQPDEDRFKAILPDDVRWQPFEAFPAGVQLAILVGDPSSPGPYVIRVKAPLGAKLLPHQHPEDRVYTVISGVFYIGRGPDSTATRLPHIHRGASSFSPGTRRIFTGRSRANTSRK